ncbi:hypothetical protein Tco_0600944 [Tanacetum coccineum]
MFEEDQPVDVAALPKFNMTSYESCMSAKDVKSLAIRHDIPLDLHPIAHNQRTDHQKEIEEEDPKIVATRERKSTRAAPKREKEKERRNEGEGSSPQSTNAEEGESSHWRAFYVPEWFIHRRCRFSLAHGALAQTNILERFEHLQADYDKLAETYSECEETTGKLIQARVDLEHNAKLSTIMNGPRRNKKAKG